MQTKPCPVSWLVHMDLFEGIEPDFLEQVARHMVWCPFSKGEVVVAKGDESRSLAFVFDGQLQVVDTLEDGSQVGLGFINRGSHFGELSVIDGGARSASVIAIKASKVAFLPGEHALGLILQNETLSLRIMKRLANMVRFTSNQLAMLSGQEVPQRVVNLLLHLSRVEGDDSALVPDLPSQKTLALMVSASRETVSRCLNDLVAKGVLRKEDNNLRIVSIKRLQGLGKPS